MSKLATFLDNHLKQKKLSQKDVARAFQEHHAARVPEADRLKWDTVLTKLSKLLKGDPEGERCFFADEHRIAALAAALEVATEDLCRLRSTRTLVLDPRLDEQAAAYFRERANEEGAQHHCEEVPDELRGDAARAAFLALCKEKRGCLAVLSVPTDLEAFKLAEIDATLVSKDALGWVLEATKDLVPLPPPPPEKLYDDDGAPMLKWPALEQEVRASLAKKADWLQRSEYRCVLSERIEKDVEEADRVGRTPTFRLAEIGPRLIAQSNLRESTTWQRPPWDQYARGVEEERAKHSFEALVGQPTTTLVWTVRDRVFAVGPARDQVNQRIAPHEANEPSSFDDCRAALRDWNLWIALPPVERTRSTGYGQTEVIEPPPRWAELRRRVLDECAVDIDSILPQWRKHANPEAHNPGVWTLQPSSEAEREQARDRIRQLLTREIQLASEQMHVLFRLQLVIESSVVLLPCGPRDGVHLVARLGSGQLLRVRVLAFPAEQAAPITWQSAKHLDGGDVHVVLEDLGRDAMLKVGPQVPSR